MLATSYTLSKICDFEFQLLPAQNDMVGPFIFFSSDLAVSN